MKITQILVLFSVPLIALGQSAFAQGSEGVCERGPCPKKPPVPKPSEASLPRQNRSQESEAVSRQVSTAKPDIARIISVQAFEVKNEVWNSMYHSCTVKASTPSQTSSRYYAVSMLTADQINRLRQEEELYYQQYPGENSKFSWSLTYAVSRNLDKIRSSCERSIKFGLNSVPVN